MRCPTCRQRTIVQIGFQSETVYWRQHRCPSCGKVFHTSEMEDEPLESISAMKKQARLDAKRTDHSEAAAKAISLIKPSELPVETQEGRRHDQC
jgi:transposase-like protein